MAETAQKKFIKERHWHTQALVDAMVAMNTNEPITRDDLAKKAGIDRRSLDGRYESAKKIALREHHVIVDIHVRGETLVRRPQEDVTIPADKGLTAARNKARSVKRLISSGVTDFDALPNEVKSTVHMQSAIAGTMLLATERSTKRTLKAAAAANGELKLGRTLELLK